MGWISFLWIMKSWGLSLSYIQIKFFHSFRSSISLLPCVKSIVVLLFSTPNARVSYKAFIWVCMHQPFEKMRVPQEVCADHMVSPLALCLSHTPVFRRSDRIIHSNRASCSPDLCAAQWTGTSLSPIHRHAVMMDGSVPCCIGSPWTFVRPRDLTSLSREDLRAVWIFRLAKSLHVSPEFPSEAYPDMH